MGGHLPPPLSYLDFITRPRVQMTLLQPLVGKGQQDLRPTMVTCCGPPCPRHMDKCPRTRQSSRTKMRPLLSGCRDSSFMFPRVWLAYTDPSPVDLQGGTTYKCKSWLCH